MKISEQVDASRREAPAIWIIITTNRECRTFENSYRAGGHGQRESREGGLE
jgi:hypothetical protein